VFRGFVDFHVVLVRCPGDFHVVVVRCPGDFSRRSVQVC
jgi:hypothetical protein